jgi:hypothetical protein
VYAFELLVGISNGLQQGDRIVQILLVRGRSDAAVHGQAGEKIVQRFRVGHAAS